MKKLVVVSLIMAGVVLMGAVPTATQAQGPGTDLKPTFLSPTPGTYVNGWPPFTVSYPKEWVEQPLMQGMVLHVAALRPSLPPSPGLVVSAFPNPGDISGSAGMLAGFFGQMGRKDVKVLYDKPSKLQDGTPAQEAEIERVPPNGPKSNTFLLATQKDGIWIWVSVDHDQGMTGDNLKRIAYSLKVPQGKQEPVKLPPDVREFLDKFCKDMDSGDVGRVMTNYSDRYVYNGMKKGDQELWYRYSPFSPITAGVTSMEVTVTMFEPQGDKAYLAGFYGGKPKSGPTVTPPIADNQIIKENGQWKWYGNQK
jgi:hypothetical protein